MFIDSISDTERNTKGSVYRAIRKAVYNEDKDDDWNNKSADLRIEKIIVKDNFIEYRVWSPCSIAYNGKVTKCGRWCTSKFIVTPDGMEIVDNDKKYFLKGKKVKSEEDFTEDNEFYKYVMGIDPNDLIGNNFRRIFEQCEIVKTVNKLSMLQIYLI